MSKKNIEQSQLKGLEFTEFSDFNAGATYLMGDGMDVSYNLNMTNLSNNSKDSDIEVSHLDYNKILAKKKEKNENQKKNPLEQMLDMSSVQARVLIGNAIDLQKTNVNQNRFVNDLVAQSIISEDSQEFEDASNYYQGDQRSVSFNEKNNETDMRRITVEDDLFMTEMEEKDEVNPGLTRTLNIEKKIGDRKFSTKEGIDLIRKKNISLILDKQSSNQKFSENTNFKINVPKNFQKGMNMQGGHGMLDSMLIDNNNHSTIMHDEDDSIINFDEMMKDSKIREGLKQNMNNFDSPPINKNNNFNKEMISSMITQHNTPVEKKKKSNHLMGADLIIEEDEEFDDDEDGNSSSVFSEQKDSLLISTNLLKNFKNGMNMNILGNTVIHHNQNENLKKFKEMQPILENSVEFFNSLENSEMTEEQNSDFFEKVKKESKTNKKISTISDFQRESLNSNLSLENSINDVSYIKRGSDDSNNLYNRRSKNMTISKLNNVLKFDENIINKSDFIPESFEKDSNLEFNYDSFKAPELTSLQPVFLENDKDLFIMKQPIPYTSRTQDNLNTPNVNLQLNSLELTEVENINFDFKKPQHINGEEDIVSDILLDLALNSENDQNSSKNEKKQNVNLELELNSYSIENFPIKTNEKFSNFETIQIEFKEDNGDNLINKNDKKNQNLIDDLENDLNSSINLNNSENLNEIKEDPVLRNSLANQKRKSRKSTIVRDRKSTLRLNLSEDDLEISDELSSEIIEEEEGGNMNLNNTTIKPSSNKKIEMEIENIESEYISKPSIKKNNNPFFASDYNISGSVKSPNPEENIFFNKFETMGASISNTFGTSANPDPIKNMELINTNINKHIKSQSDESEYSKNSKKSLKSSEGNFKLINSFGNYQTKNVLNTFAESKNNDEINSDISVKSEDEFKKNQFLKKSSFNQNQNGMVFKDELLSNYEDNSESHQEVQNQNINFQNLSNQKVKQAQKHSVENFKSHSLYDEEFGEDDLEDDEFEDEDFDVEDLEEDDLHVSAVKPERRKTRKTKPKKSKDLHTENTKPTVNEIPSQKERIENKADFNFNKCTLDQNKTKALEKLESVLKNQFLRYYQQGFLFICCVQLFKYDSRGTTVNAILRKTLKIKLRETFDIILLFANLRAKSQSQLKVVFKKLCRGLLIKSIVKIFLSEEIRSKTFHFQAVNNANNKKYRSPTPVVVKKNMTNPSLKSYSTIKSKSRSLNIKQGIKLLCSKFSQMRKIRLMEIFSKFYMNVYEPSIYSSNIVATYSKVDRNSKPISRTRRSSQDQRLFKPLEENSQNNYPFLSEYKPIQELSVEDDNMSGLNIPQKKKNICALKVKLVRL